MVKITAIYLLIGCLWAFVVQGYEYYLKYRNRNFKFSFDWLAFFGIVIFWPFTLILI